MQGCYIRNGGVSILILECCFALKASTLLDPELLLLLLLQSLGVRWRGGGGLVISIIN